MIISAKRIVIGLLLALNSFTYLYASENSAVVLMYHRFNENRLPTTNIRTTEFIEQLDYLANHHYKVWPLHKIVEFVKHKKTLPPKVVAITMDDAYASVYRVAFPILKQRHLPFTLFVATDPVDKAYSNYMTWDNLRDMVKNGVEIGNHSRTHAHLIERKSNETHQAWLNRMKEEIEYAANRIKTETHYIPRYFAYPYGEYNVALSQLVVDLKYVGFGQESGAIGPTNPLGFLPRFPISEEFADMNEFAIKVASLSLPIAEVHPQEPVTESTMPILTVKLAKKIANRKDLRCYVSRQGQGVITWHNEVEFSVTATAPFTERRSRYNCTLRDLKSRNFYWYSHLWIQPQFPEP